MNTKRFQRRIKRLLRALFTFVLVAFVLCEIMLRVGLIAYPPDVDSPTYVNRNEPLRQYSRSAYYSPAFVIALHDAITTYRYMNDDQQLAIYDAVLPGYTISHDERFTTEQPAIYTRDVWLFGSSSMWGAFVDDGHTIASYLQREFNHRGVPWRVRNMGQPEAGIAIANYWLKRTDIKPGDLVIFFDGAPELANLIISARRTWRGTLLPCQLQVSLPLAILDWLCQAQSDGRVLDKFIEQVVSDEFERDWRSIDSAKHYTILRGANWLHFLQPTNLPYADYYIRYSRGETILDPVCKNCWFDFLHYSDDGHAQIAAQIADYIVPTF